MNLPDDIIQDIIADIMNMPTVGKVWETIDPISRFLTLDNWRRIVRHHIRTSIEEITGENE